jgi:hypothetical protein
MKLRRRQKGKKAQALDVFASVVKGLAELHLAKRAGKSVGKGAKGVSKSVKQASGVKCRVKSKPVKIVGGAALVGGLGALVAKKFKGGDPEPIYTPPAPTEPMAVAPAPEVEAVVADAAEAAAEGEPDGSAEPQGPGGDESGIVVELMSEPEPEPAPEPAPAAQTDPAIAHSGAATGDDGPPAASGAAAEVTEPPGEAAEEIVPDTAEPAGGAEEPAPEGDRPGPGFGT